MSGFQSDITLHAAKTCNPVNEGCRINGFFYLSAKKIIFLFVLILCLSLGISAAWFAHVLVSPKKEMGEDRLFIVKEGSTLRGVASGLERDGIIKTRFPVIVWGGLHGYDREIKAGEYILNPGMAPIKILDTLTKGNILTYSVTIPEGFTVKQIADLLHEKGLCDKESFLSSVYDSPVEKDGAIQVTDLEGYLYPDTYKLARGISPVSIVHMMVERFKEQTAPLRERVDGSGMTMDEIVTLASIVEKETGRAEERPVIASVFSNRLKKRMRLESDPTVIYGIENFNGNLTKKDLRRPSPYNTYTERGLPAGPIANPGIDSIRAVLYPSNTDFLFFVSKNDGTHYFSKTLREHNRAVRKYQKKFRKKSGRRQTTGD